MKGCEKHKEIPQVRCVECGKANCEEDLGICESVEANWHYHLFDLKSGKDSKALCGAQTMWSPARISTWGFKSKHMPSSYCSECEKIALSNRQNTNSREDGTNL